MKRFFPFLIRVCLCLVLTGIAFLWATQLMDSLYTYRSPLHANPPPPGRPLLHPGDTIPTRRVIFILIDGLRTDTAYDSSVMPTLNTLRQQSAWATMHSRPPSYSDPGYSVLFTGAWPDLSDGPAMNFEYEDTPTWTQDNLFSAAQRRGMKNAVFAYYWFEKLIPQNSISASFYTPGYDQAADRQVVDAANRWLGTREHQLVLIHLDQVDTAGHYEGGPVDPRWSQAARRVDDLIAEILAQLDLSEDTLLVLSDHGMIDEGGHGGHETIVLREPFVMAGAGVKTGFYGDIQMVDVAPTLAALLGTNIPASSQGHILSEMLDLPKEMVTALPEALEAQQAVLLSAYQTAIGSQVSVNTGNDIVGSYQDSLEQARSQRLMSERLPRFVIAVLVAIMPLAWFIWKRSGEIPWFLQAGLIYLFLFNLGYKFIAGRTYSLSSVKSANDLILFTVSTAGLALFASWFAAGWLRKIFRQGQTKLGLWTLDLSMFVVYVLAGPILWSYALNGILVTWTLPHFPSLFIGFLSLIQVLAVVVSGIFLSLIGYIIFRLFPPRDLSPTKKTL